MCQGIGYWVSAGDLYYQKYYVAASGVQGHGSLVIVVFSLLIDYPLPTQPFNAHCSARLILLASTFPLFDA